jgi:DNA replication protein DnaD
MNGWICLHRELMNKAIWSCSTSEQKVILITLLMMANHDGRQWRWKGKKYICKPGQFVTSLKSISGNCGKDVSIQNVRTALLIFEEYEFLASETTNKNRLITICNWDSYQDINVMTNKQANKQLTSYSNNSPTEVNKLPTSQATSNHIPVTACNYDSYQDINVMTNKQANKQLTSNQQATNKQLTTNNNITMKQDNNIITSSTKVSEDNIIPDISISSTSLQISHSQKPKIDYLQFVNFYNESVGNIFGKVRVSGDKVPESRRKMIDRYLKEYSFEDFGEVIAIAQNSSFLTGDNDRQWRADFDFLTNPKKVGKILEGSYGTAPKLSRKLMEELREKREVSMIIENALNKYNNA